MEKIMTRHTYRTFGIFVVVCIFWLGPVSVFGGVRGYGAAMAQARKNYQAQMKLQATEQKAIDEADRKAAEAQAAEDKRKFQMQVKAAHLRREREVAKREAAIAKRKSENAAGKSTSESKGGGAAKAGTGGS